MTRPLAILAFTFICHPALHGQAVLFSVPSSFHTGSILLGLSADGASHQIRYTLDGSEPHADSPHYTGPLWLYDRSPQPNGIADIPTNPPSLPETFRWRPPQGQVPKSTLVRAALFDDNEQVGSVTAEEYFVGAALDSIGLPVVSIWADSAGLFGHEQGIYVPGKDYADNPSTWQPGNYYNEGPDWERTATFSYFEGQALQLRQPFELKMHGGGSRMMPCKSLRLSAKNGLGAASFDHAFFPNRDLATYKRLVLRNGGQDFVGSLMADVLMQSLLAQTGLEHQATAQVVVFLNGTYWGVHNLGERYDKYYLANHHAGGLEDIDLVEIAMGYFADEGSSADYEALIAALPNSDLSDPAQYAAVASQIDVDNFTAHHISKAYGGGDDWAGNNEQIWRPHQPGGQWRWLANDYDDAFTNPEKDAYGHATRSDGVHWPNPEWSTRLFRSLMANPGFAKRYKLTLRKQLDTTYHPDRVQRAIDSLAAIYRPEMQRQVRRWGHPVSLAQWEANIAQFKGFAAQRPERLWQNFNDYFPGIYLPPSEAAVFPNPVTALLKIDLPAGVHGEASYQVFNASGHLVALGLLTNERQNELDLSGLPAGVYLLRLVAADFSLVKKMVVR